MAHQDGCRFCGYFSGKSIDPIGAPWLEAADYCAIASRGSLVSGWTLICPLAHKLCLAADYRLPSFWDFVTTAAAIAHRRYGAVQIFEHGPAAAGSQMGCGTDHAHLHLLSLPFSVADEAVEYDRDLEWLQCKAADVHKHTHGKEYLFVSDGFEGEHTTGRLCLPKVSTSQFFRRVIATRLGVGESFDYRKNPMVDVARLSGNTLRSDVAAGTMARA
jgi:ATP adenylyltransferase